MKVTPLDLRQQRFKTVMRGYDRGEVQAFLLEVADDIKEHAQTEAGLIVREAEGQRDLLLQKAQGRLEDVQREIDALRHKRREVENDIEALVKNLNSSLEFIRDQDQRSRDERVLLHRPRPQEAPASGPQPIAPKTETGTGG